jgi:Kdo2-lipid IVA lauroyltransferase/acyltransferase
VPEARPPLRKRWKRALRTRLIQALVAVLGLLPLRWASDLGAALGSLAGALAFSERRKALASLAIAFPERTDAERRALARACFRHLGRCAQEAVCIRQLDRQLDAWVDWPAASRAVLEAALARGKGVIFVSGHVGHWELLARRVALAGYPSQTIAKETSDPGLTALVERFRASGRLKAIWRGRPGAAKQMLRALKQGEILGLLIDQDTAVQSLFVPFFGVPARTPRAAADLALRTGAAVVLGFCQRVAPRRSRLRLQEVPLPAAEGEAAALALTATLSRGIEDAIREFPEQWVWMHQRWKSKPE